MLQISYANANPDAKTDDGKPVTRLTFSEKVRALELQGRALGFIQGGPPQPQVRERLQRVNFGSNPGEPLPGWSSVSAATAMPNGECRRMLSVRLNDPEPRPDQADRAHK
jgi:hypothetical protein